MSSPFSRSLRSLEADGFHRTLPVLLLVVLLVAGWLSWFFLAHVSVYAVTHAARLEASAAVHPLQAVASGRGGGVHMILGQGGQAGDVFGELGSAAPRVAV